jgi:hypothetical protein
MTLARAWAPAWRLGESSHATDLAAVEADPPVKPAVARREAVLAAVDGLGELRDVNVVEMGAGRHGTSSRGWTRARRAVDGSGERPSILRRRRRRSV